MNLMSTYLKNVGGYKHNQLKSKSYEEISELFDNEMRRVNTFIPMDSKEVKSKKGTEESSKGTEDELKSNKMEDDKETDEVEEVDEAELKKHLVIVKDDDIGFVVFHLLPQTTSEVDASLLKKEFYGGTLSVDKSRWKFQEIFFND
ncbi:hypothetical protein Tco_0251521 [Tanacetum coccineum]